METTLNHEEVRVLAALVEKQIATPEYYPLTVKALVSACNQKSNRNPVVSYDEATIERAMTGLREKKLGWVIKRADSRVLKYGHILPEVFHLTPEETAALCVLMLRGHLTPGEIRSAGARLHDFADLDEVEKTMKKLIENDQGPLVTILPRQPGQKESRYAHLLAGGVTPDAADFSPTPATSLTTVSELEDQIELLRVELKQLREDFDAFKKQFD